MKTILPNLVVIGSLVLGAQNARSQDQGPEDDEPAYGSAVEYRPSDVEVSSGLSEADISAVLRPSLYQLRHCYERLRLRQFEAKGTLRLNFIIGPNQHVLAVDVDRDTIGDDEMRACVVAKIEHWMFPTPQKGQEVQVKIDFVFRAP